MGFVRKSRPLADEFDERERIFLFLMVVVQLGEFGESFSG